MGKKKKTDMIDLAKETIGVGVTGVAGYGVLGAMTNIPGMPAAASNVASTAGVGLQLVGVGQLAKVGLGLTDMLDGQTTTKKSGKKTSSKEVNKILGL